eukprot:9474777-Pyramimonas_sp.AAC.1
MGSSSCHRAPRDQPASVPFSSRHSELFIEVALGWDSDVISGMMRSLWMEWKRNALRTSS